MSSNLVIRADASATMGTGHVMRSLALAEAWRRNGGSAHFAAAEITQALEARLFRAGFETVRLSVKPGGDQDAARTVEIANKKANPWIVVDGYHFGGNYQRLIKAAGMRLLVVDDYGHAGDYTADLVLNQDLTAETSMYDRRASSTRLLLGPRYALLREEFVPWRDWRRDTPAVARRVLVTLGGADSENVTAKVIKSLHGLDAEVTIVAGGSNPHLEQLRSQISSLTQHRSSFLLVSDVTNIPELMASADLAVSAGGSTCWELSFMGLPSLAILLAENQCANTLELERAGALICLGWYNQLESDLINRSLRRLLHDNSQRIRMSMAGRCLIDGLGAERVVAQMASLAKQERR